MKENIVYKDKHGYITIRCIDPNKIMKKKQKNKRKHYLIIEKILFLRATRDSKDVR